MDYRKINSHVILLLVVFIVGVAIAMLSRLIILDKGVDTGTANIIFVIILGVCIIAYLVIIATLAHVIVPWIMQKLPERKYIIPSEEQQATEITNEKEKPEGKERQEEAQALPELTQTQVIETIRQNSEKRYIEKLSAQIRTFQEYTHLTMAPYIADDELLRLDEYIEYYAREESLPKDITPIKPRKLKNPDIFHFGWNMAHYFEIGKKYEVVPWLQAVFINLQELEDSYIRGKLHDSKTQEHTIPNIDNIPKFLEKQSQ
ncbi:hypothetical protein [Dysgonomonas sp. BGC7]|uniref:hypothetical protein n=1 Tax=Dysgonomonas sp. BGC7 TaxID=1658008 RepID=UPI0006837E70|nr:hypothetical protein [Dysgonomonas sp. BGC7]MBD8387928.1 magnesium transporter [Dysgonomonas sp. BGC7]